MTRLENTDDVLLDAAAPAVTRIVPIAAGGLVVVWLLLVFIPLVALRFWINKLVVDEENALRVLCRQNLTGEMVEFEAETAVGAGANPFVRRLNRELGMHEDATATEVARWRSCSAADLTRVREACERHTGMPVVALWFLAAEPQTTWTWWNPEVAPRGVATAAVLRRMREIAVPWHVRSIVHKAGANPEDHYFAHGQRLFEELVGRGAGITGMRPENQMLLSAFRPMRVLHGIAGWVSSIPKGRRIHAEFDAMYVAILDGGRVDRSRQMANLAARSSNPPLRRGLVRAPAGTHCGFFDTKAGMVYYSRLPTRFRSDIRRVDRHTTYGSPRTAASRLALAVFAPRALWRHPWHDWLPGLSCLGWLYFAFATVISVRLVWFGLPAGLNLRTKMGVAFGLGLALPVLGLVAMSVAWEQARQAVVPQQVRDRAQRTFERIDRGLSIANHQWAARLRRWNERLAVLISTGSMASSTAAVKSAMRRIIEREELCRSMFLYAADGREWFWSDYGEEGRSEAVKMSTITRTMAQETMTQLGVFRPRSGTTGLETQTILARSIAEQFLDMSYYGQMLAAPNRMHRSLLGNTDQWEGIAILQEPRPGPSTADAGLQRGFLTAHGADAPRSNGTLRGPQNNAALHCGSSARAGRLHCPKLRSGPPSMAANAHYAHRVRAGPVVGLAFLIGGNDACNQRYLSALTRALRARALKQIPELCERFPETLSTMSRPLAFDEVHLGWHTRYFIEALHGTEPRHLSRRRLEQRIGALLADPTAPRPDVLAPRFFVEANYRGVAWSAPVAATARWGGAMSLGFGLLAVLSCITLTVIGGVASLLTWPLPTFLAAMRATARGDYRWRLVLAQNDEFGHLAEVFNGMAQGLREREQLSRFVSDDVLQVVGRDEDAALAPGGELADVTVLTSDIRGFTTLSEQYPPEEIVAMLNDYFTAMEWCIREQGGTIDKFIGDAILAVFLDRPGDAPSPHATATACSSVDRVEGDDARRDDARREQRAVQAARTMRAALTVFNGRRRRAGQFTIKTGIGIASGAAVVGLVGSQSGRLARAVLGPPLERAALLEAASKQATATGIMLDGPTTAVVAPSVSCEPRPELRLPGEFAGEAIHEVAVVV